MVSEIRSETDRILVILDHSLLLYPRIDPANQNSENRKKQYLKILSFYKYVPWMTIIWVMVPEIYYFGPFFALLQPKKSKLGKMKKPPGDIMKILYQKLWSDDVRFLKYGVRQMNKQTNGQTKKVTYRVGCPT